MDVDKFLKEELRTIKLDLAYARKRGDRYSIDVLQERLEGLE